MTQRTILFRGQTRRKGDKTSMSGEPLPGIWVTGGVFPQNKGYDYAIIYTQDPKVEKYVVYAETVGQYTGISDVIGTKTLKMTSLLSGGEPTRKTCSVTKVL